MAKEKTKPNWLDPNTTAENEKLPKYVKWAWSSRAVSLAINLVFIMQLTYYCTDILLMPATLVGTLLLASKLFDGMTDLAVGFIIDHTRTKWGKARPYEIFILLAWLFTILLYSTPEFGIVGKSIYVFLMYSLIQSICTTFLNGADAVYLARSVRSSKNQVSMMSFNGALVMVGSVVMSALLPQLIQGIGTTKAGWTAMACVMGIPLGLIGMLRFVFVKEVVTDTEQKEDSKKSDDKASNKISMKEGLKCLAKNKYIFILAGMNFLVNLTTNMGTAANNYYFKWIMGDIGLASVLSLASLITPVMLIGFPVLSRKFGATTLLRVGAVISAAGFIVRIVGGTNMVTLVLGSLLITVGQVPISMMISIYLIDCMEYGARKTGVRVEGLITSVNSFTGKVGSGIASGLLGIVMGRAGYNAALAVQSASATTAIHMVFNIIPFILMVLFVVLAVIYRIDKDLKKMRAEEVK